MSYGDDFSNVSLEAIDNKLAMLDDIAKDKSLGLSEAAIKEGGTLYMELYMAKFNRTYESDIEAVHRILMLAEDFCKRARSFDENNPFRHPTPGKRSN